MKRFWKGLMLFLVFFLVACSSQSGNRSDDSMTGGGATTTDAISPGEEASPGQSGMNLIGEKVIRTVNLQYETLSYDETIQHFADTVTEYGAFMEYSNETNYSPSGSFGPESNQYRRVEYIFRVPTEVLFDFLASLDGSSAVKISERIGTEDVTQTYRDTEARIEVLNQKEVRLSELLEQAVTIEEILQIESQLSDTIAERESLQSQIDSIDDLVAFTQVHVHVTEKQRISESRGDAVSFWSRLKDAFLDSMYAFYYWIQDFAIWLVYLLPYIVLIGVFALIYFAIRKWYHNTDFSKKKEKERESIKRKRRDRTKSNNRKINETTIEEKVTKTEEKDDA